MYELISAGAKSSYLECPAKIGIYHQTAEEVYLIDSGNDKDAGRRVRKLLDEKGWRLRGILNTHSNADHIGGNRYLQQQTGCKVFAGGINGAFTAAPLLEPSFLYGGYPFGELRHKFLLAAESEVCPFTDADFPQEVQMIPLPGHFFDMVGFRTPDDTIFLADCLSSAATLQKYRLPFIYDVAAYLQTLDMVGELSAALFVPSHAEATRDIRPLAQLNREQVLQIAEDICQICAEPQSFEAVLRQIFRAYGLQMTYEQYVLVGSTVRSYLAWLKDAGRLCADFDDNRLLWRQC